MMAKQNGAFEEKATRTAISYVFPLLPGWALGFSFRFTANKNEVFH